MAAIDLTETWMPVRRLIGTENEGWYEVSNLGRLRSLEREITYRIRSRVCTRRIPGKLLVTSLAKGPRYRGGARHHLRLSLGSDAPYEYKRVFTTVASIVWEAFKGFVPKGYVVIHKNKDWLDDRLENLDCVPFREAMKAEHRIPMKGKYGRH